MEESKKLKVSVIVPVYNAEEYLSTCLKSILNQDLKDIEIICIDDGSEDNSYEICSGFRPTLPYLEAVDHFIADREMKNGRE